MLSDRPHTFGVIPVSQMFIDSSYQQAPARSMVARIADNLDPMLYGALLVNHRRDYKAHVPLRQRLQNRWPYFWRHVKYYSVIDGVYRLVAARGRFATVPCIILDIPATDEFRERLSLNTKRRRGLPPGVCAGLGKVPSEVKKVAPTTGPREDRFGIGQCPQCGQDVTIDYRGLVCAHNAS